MARVFSAVDIEDENVLKELENVRDKIDLGFNKEPGRKMHVTLQFFGDVDQREIQEIKQAMRETSVEPFTARISGVGVFPSRDFIRVVWAGFSNEGKLKQLKQQVSQHSVDSDNNYEFKPHITLLRVQNLSSSRKKKLGKSLDEFSDHFFGRIKVDRVKLFESRISSKGSRYKQLFEEKL